MASADWANLYANAGHGFEILTSTQIAYEGTGPNTALRASRGRHAEVGAKLCCRPLAARQREAISSLR